LNGIINIFKPAGITSNGVIKEVKRITGEKKIGHIGTLDPLAKGVLPLFLGKYTKLIPYCNLDDKVYEAVA
jgi:tRNA pseudouridine55 synthase